MMLVDEFQDWLRWSEIKDLSIIFVNDGDEAVRGRDLLNGPIRGPEITIHLSQCYFTYCFSFWIRFK